MNFTGDSEITIRNGHLEDAPLLAKLSEQTFFDTYHKYNTASNMQDYRDNNFTVNKLEYELSDTDTSFLVAEKDAQLIGYVRLNRANNPYMPTIKAMEISRLYVDKAYQQLKIGKTLVAIAETRSRDEGCEAIWLGVWQKNEHAIAIYKHLGFNIVGTTAFKLGLDKQDDFIMAKKLIA